MDRIDINKFNRYAVIVMTILVMFILLFLVLVMFVGVGVPPAEADPTALGQVFSGLAAASASVKLATLLLAILVFILGGVILYYELRSDLQVKSISLKQDDMGSVSIRQEGVAHLIQHVALQVPSVLEVHSEPTMTRRGLNIHCRVVLDPAAPIEDVKGTLRSKISQEVLRHLNVNVVDVGILTTMKALPNEQT